MTNQITLVKKVLANGEDCRKCLDVMSRLEKDHLLAKIDDIVIADERDNNSAGMRLARQFDVQLAPFFLVRGDEQTQVYTSYLALKRDVLKHNLNSSESALELMDAHPDLDFI